MNFGGKSVLVTGAGGFIGMNLVEKLVSEGADVNAVIRSGESDDLLKTSAKIHKADICNRKEISNVVRKTSPDYIFHLAASLKRDRDPAIIDEVMDVNFRGTLNLLDAAKDVGVKRFVFPSTADVYGGDKTPFF